MKSAFDSMVSMNWDLIWSEMKLMQANTVECDDAQGFLSVTCANDGDMHVWLDQHPRGDSGFPSFRARTFFGGGRNERVRYALLLLALAIKDDSNPEIEPYLDDEL